MRGEHTPTTQGKRRWESEDCRIRWPESVDAVKRPARRLVPAGCHRALHLRTVWGCGSDARLRKRADRLRGALWQAGWGGFAWRRAFRAWVRAEPVSRLRTARQSRHRPPTRPRGGRTPRETRQNLPVDALRPVWQEWDGMNESEKQFSFTRVASSTSGHAKKQIPISSVSVICTLLLG